MLGGALIAGVGLLLVCWGLWGDRSKGRARCPKCWYDMRGTVPRLTCPECGHDAGQEDRLHKHHRRWMRAVVGVVLVLLPAYPLSIVVGWRREQSTIREYDIGVLDERRIGPAWLVDRLPAELARFFDRVDSMHVFEGAKLAACPRLRYLRSLDCQWGFEIADADFVHLRGLSNLERLNLTKSQVTDAGLAHLKGLSGLRLLWLAETGTTDVGLAHLTGLSNLVYLDLGSTQVTGAGVAKLKQALPNLKVWNW